MQADRTSPPPAKRHLQPGIGMRPAAVRERALAALQAIADDPETTAVPDALLGHSWFALRATPLHGFDSSARSLGRYRQALGATLQARGHVGGSTLLPPSEERDVARVGRIEVSLLEGLEITTGDPKAVHIVLHAKNRTLSGAEAGPVFQAVLCGCATPQPDDGLFTHFPLLLAKGNKILLSSVQQWLESTFDCTVAPLTIPTDCLNLYASLWAIDEDPDRAPSAMLELVFTPPLSAVGLEEIRLEISSQTLATLAASVADQIQPDEDLAQLTMIALKSHFRGVFGVRLDILALTRVSTPVSHVAHNGRLKITSQAKSHPREALNLLNFIVSIARGSE